MALADVANAAAAAPDSAGVYFFLGAERELLYVGKAGSLRKRLQQHARPKLRDGERRRATLYERAVDVRWEEHPDEDAAACREADLIVALRPLFNASHTTEGQWVYLAVGSSVTGRTATRFALQAQPDAEAGRLYGCFPHLGKGVSSRPAIACSDGYAAFLRMLWAADAAKVGDQFPRAITGSAPSAFETLVDRSRGTALHAFLSGTSHRLLSDLATAGARLDRYMQPALARDRRAAEAFFVHGTRALRELRLRHGQPTGPMTRKQIEDLLIAEVRASIGDFKIEASSDASAVVLGRRAARSASIAAAIRRGP